MYEILCDEKVLFNCLIECRKNVHWKRSVRLYTLYSIANIAKLASKMRDRKWMFEKHKEFIIKDRGKVRHVQALSMDERIIQKALRQYILDKLLTTTLIYDSGATVKGKGVDFARKRIVQHLRKYYAKHGNNGYVLQIDIRSYFSSIDHNILLSMLNKKIKDTDVLGLISESMSLYEHGLCLGSEMNQILSTWYLSPLDHICKERFRIKYYGRYMDDIYILHESKEYLESVLLAITDKLSELGLRLNDSKTMIIPISRGFTYMKVFYKYTATGRIIRRYGKHQLKKLNNKLAKMSSKNIDSKRLYTEYKSWRNNIRRYDSRSVIKRADAIYNKHILKEVI